MGRRSSFKLNRSGGKAKAVKKQLSAPGATSAATTASTPSRRMTPNSSKKTPKSGSHKKRKGVMIVAPLRRLIAACTPSQSPKGPINQKKKNKKNKTPKRGSVATSTPKPGFVQVWTLGSLIQNFVHNWLDSSTLP